MLNVLIRSGCSFICNNEAHASGYMSIPGHSQCHSLNYFILYAMQRILMMKQPAFARQVLTNVIQENRTN